MTKRRSARGDTVDFDLLRIKEQIAAGPKPVNVQSREEFIDRKVRRRAKKQEVKPVSTAVEVDLTLDNTHSDEQQALYDNATNNVEEELQQPSPSEDTVRKIKKIR